MTVLAGHSPDTGVPSPAPPPWRSRIAPLVVLGVLVVAIAAFAVTRDTTGDTSGSQTLGLQRIAATRMACEQWVASGGPATDGKLASGWCAGMTGWMSDQMAAGHMMGTTMWTGPQSMRDACHQWIATAPAGVAAATTGACDQMVGWMSEHMGQWSGSSDWDRHMGDWGAGMMTR